MSLNVSGLSAYTNQVSMDLITKSVIGGKTAKYATIQTGIKTTDTINIMDTTLNLLAGGCGFTTGTNSVALTQRNLTVCSLKLNENICVETLETYYTQASMKAGAAGVEVLPFEQLYSDKKVADLNQINEKLIWQGAATASGNLSLCANSFLQNTAGSINGLSGYTASSITSENVVGIVNNMITQLYTNAEDILDQELVLFVSNAVFNLYVQAMQASGANYWNNGLDMVNGELIIPATNIKMIATVGLSGTSKMVLTFAKNMFIGTDLMSDSEGLKIWYSEDNAEVRVSAKWKIGANFVFPSQVVYVNL